MHKQSPHQTERSTHVVTPRINACRRVFAYRWLRAGVVRLGIPNLTRENPWARAPRFASRHFHAVRRTTMGTLAVGILMGGLMLANLASPGITRGGEARSKPRGLASNSEIFLLAAGDLRGEIKPCGCSPEGQMGGLPRRLTMLENSREGGFRPVLVDLGNNFPEPSDQGMLKVELIQKLLREMNLDAILPGPNELAVGADSLAVELPYLVSNDRLGRAFLKRVDVRRGATRLAIYGYLSPDLVYQGSQSVFDLEPVADRLLTRLKKELRPAGTTRGVLLFRGSDVELQRFASAGLFDLIISGNPFADELNQITTRRSGSLTLPQVPTKGQGVTRISFSGGSGDITWLTERFADHPSAVRAMEQYDEQVKQLFFKQMEQMENSRTEAVFAGSQSCKDCHRAAFDKWGNSRHSGAYATLIRVGKQFDPECLACHVVGLGQGGFINVAVTANLKNVQCENCHGASIAHSANPARAKPVPRVASKINAGKPGEATCRACHRGSHSPKFDYRLYWPKIKHE